jgi:hypothetical protein
VFDSRRGHHELICSEDALVRVVLPWVHFLVNYLGLGTKGWSSHSTEGVHLPTEAMPPKACSIRNLLAPNLLNPLRDPKTGYARTGFMHGSGGKPRNSWIFPLTHTCFPI